MKKNTFILLLNVFFLVSLFGFSISNTLPKNPLIEGDKNLLRIIPQGWGFFSKDPREETLYVEELKNSSELQWPNNNIKNFFGISRYGRSQGTEVGIIQQKIPNDKWKNCKQGIDSCRDKVNTVTVYNDIPKTSVCGNYIFYKSEPVPWSWNKYTKQTEYNSKAIRVNVQCQIT